MNVYLCGASGTGKTTLAKYVEETYGLHRLPSAARLCMEDMGLAPDAFAELIADKPMYHAFQTRVCHKQFTLESACFQEGKPFVSDRAFEHVVYTAMYGTYAPAILQGGIMRQYFARLEFAPDTYVLFFIRPSRIVQRLSIKDGDRSMFLDWDKMNQFDGAVRFILESRGIPYVEIDTPDMLDRRAIIDGNLTRSGLVPKEGECPLS